MTTTEIAVITFLLVGAAIVVLGIIYSAAQSNAENIPVQRAVAQLQDAALDLAQLCRTTGDHDAAIGAVEYGLKLGDPAEPLYLEWARIEAERGRTEQVHTIWERLCRKYNDDPGQGDVWTTAPTPTTERAFTALCADPNTRSGI